MDSGTKHFIRGGQTILHNLRMFGQVASKLLWVTVLITSVAATIWFFSNSIAYDRYVVSQYFLAKAKLFFNGIHATQYFIRPDGIQVHTTSFAIAHAPQMAGYLNTIISVLYQSLFVGFGISLVLSITITAYLKKRGKAQSKEKRIKGDFLASAKVLKKRLRKKIKDMPHVKRHHCEIILSKEKIRLPFHFETRNMLLHGAPGTGKSTVIKSLLHQLRARGDKVIIYDKGCSFVKHFFRPNEDILLNPLDARTASWSLWEECRDGPEFEALAAAQIPMPQQTQDPFWVNAARTIFATMARKMANDPEKSTLKLLEHLLTADLSKASQLLMGTEAESLMTEKVEKMAISIKSVLATYLKSMRFIKDDAEPFGIRRWLQDESQSNWLFISSVASKHEALRPLMTSWIDIAINELMSLGENLDRRIYFILDEVTSLNQLPYYLAALSDSRRFGGSFVTGIQNIAQMNRLYGQAGAQEISALHGNRFLFRQTDPEIARWSALNCGEEVIREIREGVSYGANTMRDGVSISHHERVKPVVTPSQIQTLQDLSCYCRFPGDLPITKLHFDVETRSEDNPDFIPRAIDYDKLTKVDTLIAQNSVHPSETQTQTSSPTNTTHHNNSQLSKNKTLQEKSKDFKAQTGQLSVPHQKTTPSIEDECIY